MINTNSLTVGVSKATYITFTPKKQKKTITDKVRIRVVLWINRKLLEKMFIDSISSITRNRIKMQSLETNLEAFVLIKI